MDLRSQKRRSFLAQPLVATRAALGGGGSSTILHGHQTQRDAGTSPENIVPDLHLKLVCVGDGGCGKTSLLNRYKNDQFSETYIPTVFENYVTLVRKGPEIIELALWDTAGQEDYDRLRALSYPETDIVVICYSIDNPISLDNTYDKWIPEVAHYCPDVPYILVGLKSDTRATESTVTREEAVRIAVKYNASALLECSAKTGANVKDVFSMALRVAMNPHERYVLREAKQLGISVPQSKRQSTIGDYQGPQASQGTPITQAAPPTTLPDALVPPHSSKPRRKRRHCIII